jgi:hypothetical protein
LPVSRHDDTLELARDGWVREQRADGAEQERQTAWWQVGDALLDLAPIQRPGRHNDRLAHIAKQVGMSLDLAQQHRRTADRFPPSTRVQAPPRVHLALCPIEPSEERYLAARIAADQSWSVRDAQRHAAELMARPRLARTRRAKRRRKLRGGDRADAVHDLVDLLAEVFDRLCDVQPARYEASRLTDGLHQLEAVVTKIWAILDSQSEQ